MILPYCCLMPIACFQAIHSDTGALASCSGWQTISTRLGPPCASASFNTFAEFVRFGHPPAFDAEGGGDRGVVGGREIHGEIALAIA